MNENQIKEYIRCRKDPVYFLKTYAKIRHPTKGLLNFRLWDFQEDVMKSFLEHSYNIILKARQLGLSTLCAGYITWMIIFYKDKSCFVLATKQETAINMIDKVKVIIQFLPDWLKPATLTDNKQSVELANGSKVKASGTTKDGIRSEALSLLVVDECVAGDTKIRVRSKKTGEIREIFIKDLFLDEYK